MALPSSGTLSINDIVGEFGGSAPHSLSEYYRGGGLVPNIAANSSVPTSGTISISNFYGAQNALWAVDMTAGEVDIPFFSLYHAGYVDDYDGNGNGIGSLTDYSVDFLSGATCKQISNDQYGNLFFIVSGVHSNSGWTTMAISGIGSFNRASASVYSTTSGNTEWRWTGFSGFSNGTTYTIAFT